MMRNMFEGLGNAGNAQGTTQLVKSRQPPLWTRQQFDRWRLEMERWYDNNQASDEEKYID